MFEQAAAISSLLATTPLAKAEKVVVAGGSAGGIGAFQHADYVRELPQLRNADVRATPLCGWFFPNVGNYSAWEQNPEADFNWGKVDKPGLWTDPVRPRQMLRQSAVATEPQLTTPAWVFVWPQGKPESAWADQSCKAALKGEYYRCGSIDVAYKYIKTPLFIAENQFDLEQIFGELKVPKPDNKTTPAEVAKELRYLRYYGQRMRASLAQVGAAVGDNNGLWAPACLDHGADFGFNHSKLSINGIGLKEAVMSWYDSNGTGGASANVHVEGCAAKAPGIPCSTPPGRCHKMPFGSAEVGPQ